LKSCPIIVLLSYGWGIVFPPAVNPPVAPPFPPLTMLELFELVGAAVAALFDVVGISIVSNFHPPP
jgi:hypothetical protein